MRGYVQVDRLARHHFDVLIHDGAKHLDLAPRVEVEAGEIGHDLVRGRGADHIGDRHLVVAHGDIFLHDLHRVWRDEQAYGRIRAGRCRQRVHRVVEPGLRVAQDVHASDLGTGTVVGMLADRQIPEVDILSCLDDLLDGPRLDQLIPPGRLTKPIGERLEVVRFGHTEGTRPQRAMLEHDVEHAVAGLLDDVFEQDRRLALGRQGPDVFDAYRFGNPGDDVGVGLEVATQVFVEHEIPAVAGFRGRRDINLGTRHWPNLQMISLDCPA